MRLALLFGTLTLAFLLAVWTTQVPKPRPADAPAAGFSAARAMTDIEQIARAPHPVGSAEHARVRAYLSARMTQLGLSPEEQSGPLSPGAIRRLKKEGGDPDAANNQAINLIGVLPGKDRSQPAVMLMAHYDTVVGSPGAADDSTGVGAVLEAVRAVQAQFLGVGQQDDQVALYRAARLDGPHGLQHGADAGGIVGRAGRAHHGVIVGHQHDGGLAAVFSGQDADQVEGLIIGRVGIAAGLLQALDRTRGQRPRLLLRGQAQLGHAGGQVGADAGVFG